VATQSLPAAYFSTLWTKNQLLEPTSSLIGVDVEDEFYPAANLLDPLRSLRARRLQYSDWDLGAVSTPIPTGLALIDSNVGENQASAVELWAHNTLGNLGTTTGTYRKWTFATTSVRAQRGVWRFFLGADDTGQANDVRFRYYRIKIIGIQLTTDFYHELALPWLGTYFTIPLGTGASLSLRDVSPVEESFNGAAYIDTLPAGHVLDFQVPLVQKSDLWALRRELIRVSGSQHVILDLFSGSSDANEIAESGLYGRLAIDGPLTVAFEGGLTSNLSVKFIESLA